MSLVMKKVGTFVGEKEIDNQYFANYLDTNDEWIQTRTGIKTRYFTDFSLLEIAIKAIENLQLTNEELAGIDGIFFATMSSTQRTPALSALIQQHFNLREEIVCLDINTACSSFINATVTADAYMKSNLCNNVLIIGAEKMTDIIDLNDRGTAILFGDGAGAIYCTKSDKETLTNISLKTRGNSKDIYGTNCGLLEMNGQNVFKFAVVEGGKQISELNEKLRKEIKYYLLHQANSRIIDSIGRKQGIEQEKLLINVDKYGNTSSASIILLLAEIFTKLENGDKLYMLGYGGGLTWGSFVYHHQKENNE